MGGRPRRLHASPLPRDRRGARIRARCRLRGMGATRRPPAEPRHRHGRRHVRRRPDRVRHDPPDRAAARCAGSRCCSTCPSPSVPDSSAVCSGSACRPRGSARAACRTRHDPRHRRRDDRAACGARRRDAQRSGPCTTARSHRRRRHPVSSSSTRPRWGASCSTPPRAAIADAGSDPVTAVGITNQRASTIVWDRSTGEPIAPALGWQDLRTVGECIMAKIEHGLPLAPNQSATKIAWLLANTPDVADRDLCFGTVDSWVAWVLSEGAVHVTDHSNAAVTGLFQHDGSGWNDRVCELLGIPVSILPSIVDSSGLIGDRIGAARRAADRGDGRRPAGVVGRPGLCPARPGEDHVRHRRDARRVHRQRRAGLGEPHRQRHVPDRRVVTRRRAHVGRRGGHADRRDVHRVASRRSRPDRHECREPRRRGRLRDVRRRGVRARPARPRHAAVGLRRPRDVARPDPRHRPGTRRAGRARGRRPPWRRHGGRGRDRHRVDHPAASRSTAA